MAVRSGANEALPTSHFFFTIARGRTNRTMALRCGPVFAGLSLLPVLLLWLVGSTLYLALHDDLVASFMLRQRDMQYEYEDRIASLKSQLSRAESRELLTQRSISAKLDELTAREADLQTRSGIVSRLDEQAAQVLAPALPSEKIGPASAMGETVVPAQAGRSSAAEPGKTSVDRMTSLSTSLDTITASQQDHLATLNQKVQTAFGRYQDVLAMTGLSLDRLTASNGSDSGGPFVPLAKDDDGSPFARSTVSLQLNLSQASRVARAMVHVPLNRPLKGNPEVTSPFGARVDPFLGRPAMHTGLDLAEDAGTEVHPTAPGRVTFAGSASGYGLMVEVDHGAGLTTRYAHLSEIAAAVGQSVRCTDVIGQVGSTGRATGPHLHYETRIDGEPVDPARFLAAGRHLYADRRPS